LATCRGRVIKVHPMSKGIAEASRRKLT
jgi:hypothetical protein